jgi:hypothetical protein
MRKGFRIGLMGVLLGTTVWAQQDTPPPAAQGPATPAPAFGQDQPAPQVTQAPPVTSLDQASLEPTVAARSFLQPGVHATESVNSNLGSNGGAVGITRLLGSLDLTRLWSRYAFAADYVGGAALYSDDWSHPSQVHEAAAAQRYAWRTGQLQACDHMTYLPEGSFGFSGFNGAGGNTVGGSCGGSFGGGSTFGSIGVAPRLTNAASLDLRESLSPRSSITAAAGYTFTDFLHSKEAGTINSHQESAQAGYSRVLNHFDQLGLQYGFEQFQFPTQGAGTIVAHTVEGVFEHQVSGRMDLTLGAGPEFIIVRIPEAIVNGTTVPAHTENELTTTARAILRYRFPRDSVTLSYNRHVTAGSGIQLGSQTDEVRASLGRPLTRLWTGSVDVGYSHHRALQAAAVTGNALSGTYQAGFAGGGLTRRLGRYFSLQMHYQYTYEYFARDSSGDPCTKVDCSNGHTFNRHIGDITLSWHPAPIRLD